MALTYDETSCPSVLDLWEYRRKAATQGGSGRIAAHISGCPACAEIVRNLQSAPVSGNGAPGAAMDHPVPDDIRRASMAAASRFGVLLSRPPPSSVAPGQIWSTVPIGEPLEASVNEAAHAPRLVITLVQEKAGGGVHDGAIVVAPLSLEIAYRADRDLYVPAEASPFGYAFMAEVWNEVSVLRAQLGQCLGVLDQPYKRYLGLLYQVQLGAATDLRPLTASVGPAITHGDDPRVAFQEDEHEALQDLRRPLLQSLGDQERRAIVEPAEIVLRLLRESLPDAFIDDEDTAPDLTVGSIAARIQGDHAAARSLPAADVMTNRQLLENTTQLPEQITASAVGRLLEGLGVQASQRYRELFRRVALELGFSQEQRGIELAAARRQLRHRPRTKTERSGPESG